MRQATEDEIRRLYHDQDMEILIRKTGKILFRHRTGFQWREGRYASEYKWVDGDIVLT